MEELLEQLCGKDTRLAYQALLSLKAESDSSPAVYAYFDRFLEMMDDANSYLRTRGLLLLCANARWDRENKLDGAIDRFLSHISDPKPITARQFIQALPQVALHKPALALRIRAALENADLSAYPESMAPLVLKDITNALRQI